MNGQSEAIAFLSRPETFAASEVKRVDTHVSIVFLAGPCAYKLKRAVTLPYLDFSTLTLRRRSCEAEVAINRRTAPQIYERVAAITREADGRLAFDGAGEAVDYVVVMKRFDEDGLFDRLAGRGALDADMMARLADVIARFHAEAERRPGFGGSRAMADLIALNERNFARHAGTVFDAAACAKLSARSRAELERVAWLLDDRRARGFVRHCHGDLHLRNICLYEGAPLLFDAIEFSEPIACIDILYDLAFLLMDLEHRDLRLFGNTVFNRYLAQSTEEPRDLSGLAALPLFLSLRAAVRAHVGADAAATQSGEVPRAAARSEAGSYLDLAAKLLSPPPPRLLAIGGLSGSGKSTLARALAPAVGGAPGALVLRSDIIRKRLFGADEFARLPEAAYAEALTARVYAAIAAGAEAALAAGHSVIADAVYGHTAQREALAEVARRAGAAFTGLWLDAPAAALERRIESRLRDASDATVAVLRAQLAQGVADVTWRRIDAAPGPDAVLAAARALLH